MRRWKLWLQYLREGFAWRRAHRHERLRNRHEKLRVQWTERANTIARWLLEHGAHR